MVSLQCQASRSRCTKGADWRSSGVPGTSGCPQLGRAKRAPKTLKDPAGNLRFRAGSGPKPRPNQAQNILHGTQKPAHNDSERFWANFGLFRRRSKIINCEIAQPSLAALKLPTTLLCCPLHPCKIPPHAGGAPIALRHDHNK